MPDIKNLPAKGFPHDYDTISLSASAPTAITLRGEGVETKMTLTPDGAGVVALHGFAAILRDLTSDWKPRTFTLSVGSANYSFKVLPCKIDLAVSTEDFIARHFLSLQRGEKVTYDGATEILTFCNAEDTPETPTVQAVFYNSETRKTWTATSNKFQATSQDGVFRLVFNVGEIVPPNSNYTLFSILVKVGAREARYTIAPTMGRRPTTIIYKNAFGQDDTFHFFGTTLTELKPTRSSASFSGKARNYKVSSIPEYRLTTGTLRPESFDAFNDVCSAEVAYLDVKGRPEICITENEMKISDDLHEAQQGTLTFRFAQGVRLYDPNDPVRTFDETFDMTFK